MDRRFISCGRDESGAGNVTPALTEYAKARSALGNPSRAVRRQAAKLAKKQKKHR